MHDETDDEIDLLELWQVIWQHRKFVLSFTIGVVVIAVIWSLAMTNIYRSKTVIIPSGQSASRLGSLASLAGISSPISASATEILALLKSDILKKEVIEKYHLLPILFYKSWDKKKNRWKKPSEFSVFIAKIRSKFGNNSNSNARHIKLTPDMDAGMKALGGIFDVNVNKKLGIIDMSIEYPNPDTADRLLNDIITTLKNHMTAEAIRIAKKKSSILKRELLKTSDPTIQQALYRLIVKQMARITTAKVSENFAFKVIDPPYSPDKKYKPKRKLIVILAFITSLIFSIFLVFFIESVKNAKKRRADNSADTISVNNEELTKREKK